MFISEGRLRKIEAVVKEAEALKRTNDDRRRFTMYNKVYLDSVMRLQFLPKRFLVECRKCSSWCKIHKRGLAPLWPGEDNGNLCPLCQDCRLTPAGIV